VNGLYRKALAIYERRTHLHIVRPGEPAPTPALAPEVPDGITTEERQLIEGRINRIMEDNRIDVSPSTMSYTPRRKGVLLPLVTWLSVAAVVVIAIIAISTLLNRQERTLATGVGTVLSAESKLIAALKQESDQQLRERDRTIREAQDRLAALNQERDQLRDQADTMVKARETELRGQFDRLLADEKARLERQGFAAAALEQQLKKFEESRRQELDRQVTAARKQAADELAAREKALGDLSAQYQRDLESARQDRLRVQSEARDKEAELQKQLAQKTQAVESERARVTDELARLRAQQEQERLVLDQILSGYERVNRSLQADNYPRALQDLETLKGFFDTPSVSALPTMQKRRGVEMFLIGSLDELIRGRQNRARVDTAALMEASTLLSSVTELVGRGDTLSQSGDFGGARDAYAAALGRIPAVSRGYARLEELRGRDIAAGLRQANVFYQAGNFLGSLERYRQALTLVLGDEALSRQLADNVMNAGYRILAADDLAQMTRLRAEAESLRGETEPLRAEAEGLRAQAGTLRAETDTLRAQAGTLRSENETLRAQADRLRADTEPLRSEAAKRRLLAAKVHDLAGQYKAYTLLVPQASAADPSTAESLATMLQAKILVRQILDSEPARSRYPGLGTAIDRYFAALAEQGRAEGRRAAMEGLTAVLARLGMKDAGSLPVLTANPFAGEPDPLLALFDQVERLLR
jgi:hypothetical protein